MGSWRRTAICPALQPLRPVPTADEPESVAPAARRELHVVGRGRRAPNGSGMMLNGGQPSQESQRAHLDGCRADAGERPAELKPAEHISQAVRSRVVIPRSGVSGASSVTRCSLRSCRCPPSDVPPSRFSRELALGFPCHASEHRAVGLRERCRDAIDVTGVEIAVSGKVTHPKVQATLRCGVRAVEVTVSRSRGGG